MNAVLVVRAIGASCLLQPPLTALLAHRLRLREAFAGLPPLPGQILANAAFAAVALPTSLGCLVAAYPVEVLSGNGMGRAIGWLLAVFWCWRCGRQRSLAPLLPRGWAYALYGIFLVQGPVFAILLACVTVP